MPYELRQTADGFEMDLTASDRHTLFQDALRGGLQVIYGQEPAPGEYAGQVVPLQAVGGDDMAVLRGLLEDLSGAASDVKGTLLPPKWLSFDERRVSANLPITLPETPSRRIHVKGVCPLDVPPGSLGARIELSLQQEHG